MAWYQIILDYMNTLVWPLTVLGISFFFRTEIKNIFNRLNEVSIKDIRLSFPFQKIPKSEVAADVQEEIEGTIYEKKNKIKSKELIGATSTDKELRTQISALLTQIATLQSALLFERTYAAIFGTQIVLLQSLRSNIEGLYYVVIAKVYEDWRKNDDVLKNYALSDYLAFLEIAQLISNTEIGGQRRYNITSRGVDFLNYIEKAGYPKEKPH